MPYRTARWYLLGVGLLVAAGTLQHAGVLRSASGVATLLVAAAMAIAMMPDGRKQGGDRAADAPSPPPGPDVEAQLSQLTAREAQAHAELAGLRQLVTDAGCLVVEFDVSADPGWLEHPENHSSPRWELRFVDEQAARRVVDVELTPEMGDYLQALDAARYVEDNIRIRYNAQAALRPNNEVYSQEYRVSNRKGELQWLGETMYVVVQGPGHWRVIGTIIDITARKQAEELARISAERLRQTLSHARAFLFEGEVHAPPDWATGNGTDGFKWELRLVDPQAAARLLALETPAGEQMKFDAIPALRSPDDRARWQGRFRWAIDRNLPSYTQDYPITNSLGKRLWLTEIIQLTQIGPACWRLSGLVVDGEANRLAKDDLRAVMRQAGCIIWAGRIHMPAGATDIGQLTWDVDVVDEEAAQRVLPLDTTDRSYRMAWIAARLPEYQQERDRLFTEAIAQANCRFRHEFRCQDRHGVIHWISQDVHLDQIDANVWRLTAVCVNTTAQKNIEVALQEARKAAEQANVAKTAFLASMSHEIRTPMTAILGYADLLVDAALPEDEKVRCVETIRRNGEHLLAIINDILDLSKIEAGRFIIENIPTSPRQIARDVLQLLEPQAEAKSLKLQLQIAPDVPENIHSDPTRLRQILLNLAGNAVKFTPHGSASLRLTMQPLPRPQLRMEVADTGIGMSAEQLDRIFSPFQQCDATVSRRFGGTGLGLAIAQRLARMLGGDVSAASEVDRGSTFVALVDAVAVVAPTHSDLRPAATTKVNLVGVRVLLAEDGMDNRRLISFHLHRAGCEITCVEDGRQARDLATEALAKGKPFQIILMDMQMPVMDGYAASRELRARGYNLPIIALTAHAMAGDRERCLEVGCNDYAAKPVNVPQMLQMLAQQLAECEHFGQTP